MLSLMTEATRWPGKWTPLALALLWTGVGLFFATAGGGVQDLSGFRTAPRTPYL